MLMTGEGTKKEECLLKVPDDPPDPPATAGQQDIPFLHLESDALLKVDTGDINVCISFLQGTQKKEQIALQICKKESEVSITEEVTLLRHALSKRSRERHTLLIAR